ncbi:MAG: response regulator transcription factor [Planctomycetes bacterium]|nr:response regulator transcription factor [Planctomycetota bacterium]
MKKARILLVDDEPDLVELVRHHLTKEHYEVVIARNGEAGLAEAQQRIPDLVILDLMLPGIGGLEVCRRLRADARTAQIPIVMLTAKGEESDAVIGLAQGADDYVRKPFGMKELIARVGARLRAHELRTGDQGQRVLRFGDMVIDSVKHEVTIKDAEVRLTVTEFKLLRHLVANKGRAFTRNDLLNAVLGQEAVVIDRNVDVHVATLRKKLGRHGEHILTIRGLGYKFAEAPLPVE